MLHHIISYHIISCCSMLYDLMARKRQGKVSVVVYCVAQGSTHGGVGAAYICGVMKLATEASAVQTTVRPGSGLASLERQSDVTTD